MADGGLPCASSVVRGCSAGRVVGDAQRVQLAHEHPSALASPAGAPAPPPALQPPTCISFITFVDPGMHGAPTPNWAWAFANALAGSAGRAHMIDVGAMQSQCHKWVKQRP